MKFLVLGVFILMFETSAFSQSYFPLLGDSNKWYVDISLQNYLTSAGETISQYSAIYYTAGDTIITKNKYKKFYINDPYTMYSYSPSGLVGYIREDTSLRKVFFIGKDSINETLIYDFSLNTGDSMYVSGAIEAKQIQYQTGYLQKGKYRASISTTTTNEGNRKSIELSSNHISVAYNSEYPNALHWIESIGSLQSPLYFYEPLNGTYISLTGNTVVSKSVSLGCAYRNGTWVYGSGTCQYNNSWITKPNGIETDSNKQAIVNHLVFSSQFIAFQSDAFMNDEVRVEIVNLYGQVLKNFVIPATSRNVYKCSFNQPLNAGIYIIRIYSKDKYFAEKFALF